MLASSMPKNNQSQADIGLQLANVAGSAQRPPEATPFHDAEHGMKKPRSRRSCLLVLAAVLFTAACIGLIVGLVQSNNSGSSGSSKAGIDNKEESSSANRGKDIDYGDRLNAMRFRISQAAGGSTEAKFLDSTSPQSRALDWLVFDDLTISTEDIESSSTQPIDSAKVLQRYALLVFAYSTNVELWRVSSGLRWDRQFDVNDCDFVGVDCDADGQVTDIDLDSKNLSGLLPDELRLLTQLKSLRLGENSIQGTVPRAVYDNLANLEYIDISFNRIAGSIPSNIGALTKLKGFLAERTYLDGSLPTEALKELTDMRFFDVSNAFVSGNIFDAVLEWRNLEILHLGDALVQGSIPSSLGATHPNLRSLDLMNTGVQGSIPPEIGLLSNLERLLINSPYLTGNIPNKLGQLTLLEELHLEGPLEGTLPTQLGRLTNLKSLGLAYLNVAGTVPSEYGNLVKLERILIGNSPQIEGVLPSELSQLGNIVQLGIYSTGLSGEIPICPAASGQEVYQCTLICVCCANPCVDGGSGLGGVY